MASSSWRNPSRRAAGQRFRAAPPARHCRRRPGRFDVKPCRNLRRHAAACRPRPALRRRRQQRPRASSSISGPSRCGIERIADADLAVGIWISRCSTSSQRDAIARTGVASSCSAGQRCRRHRDDRRNRQIEVGGGVDDHRIVARTLEQAATEAGGNDRCDGAPDRRMSR